MSFRVAVAGATGAVGREILKTLAERKFPASEVAALASGRSAGSQVSFGEDQVLTVKTWRNLIFRAGILRCSRPAPRSRPSTRRAPRPQAAS